VWAAEAHKKWGTGAIAPRKRSQGLGLKAPIAQVWRQPMPPKGKLIPHLKRMKLEYKKEESGKPSSFLWG